MWIDTVSLGLQSYAPGSVPSRVPARSGQFREELRTATRENHVVGEGETLSHIVAQELRSSGLRSDRAAIYAGVERVARHNGIENPDLIFVGSEIDLSALPEATIARGPREPRARDGQGLGVSAPDHKTPVRGEAWGRLLDAPARLSSEFGKRRDPFTGHRRQHDGIDLAAAKGTGIHALMPGEVVSSGWMRGYGNTVVVRHADGLETVYAHTARNLVSEGDKITEKTVLGEVGSTGRSTGPHLHFEVRRNGQRLDPAPFLDAGQTLLAGGG